MPKLPEFPAELPEGWDTCPYGFCIHEGTEEELLCELCEGGWDTCTYGFCIHEGTGEELLCELCEGNTSTSDELEIEMWEEDAI